MLTGLPYEPLPQFRSNDLQDDAALADCAGMRIGILIVAYNASSKLVPVLKRITPSVWDNVEEVLALGYGGNQKAGCSYFLEKGFDVVVQLHADGQYAPEILAHLYRPIVQGAAEAVFGSRMMSNYGGALKGGMRLYKYVGNRILSAFENRALGLRLTEFHCGYRAYSLRALGHIELSRMTNDFHFATEIIIKLQHQGFRIVEVPVPISYAGI
jgi:hypothetical protein